MSRHQVIGCSRARRFLLPASFIMFLLSVFRVFSLFAQSPALGVPAGPKATLQDNDRRSLRRALVLADAGDIVAANQLVSRIVMHHPKSLWARTLDVKLQTFYRKDYDGVRREYDGNCAGPDSIVFCRIALLQGSGYMVPDFRRREWLKDAATQEPNLAWGLYARATLIQASDPAGAVALLLRSLDQEPVNELSYDLLLSIEQNQLRDLDTARITALRMTTTPEFKSAGLSHLWSLRLLVDSSGVAKTGLHAYLDDRLENSHDLDELIAVQQFATLTLGDRALSQKAEERIKLLDSGWYAERGMTFVLELSDGNGRMRQVPIEGHAVTTVFAAYFIADDTPAEAKISRLERLRSATVEDYVRNYLDQRLLAAAEEADDNYRIKIYAEDLAVLDPKGALWLAKASLARMAIRVELNYAHAEAVRAVRVFNNVRLDAPEHNTDPDWLKESLTRTKSREEVERIHAIVLEADGEAALDENSLSTAEQMLRASLALRRSEVTLTLLAKTVREKGDEAGALALERDAREVFATAVRKAMVDRPGHDFTLTAVTGEKVHSKDKRGQPVLLYFFATWCGTCLKDEPLIVRLQHELGDRLAILAISIDKPSEQPRVKEMANELHNAFPILLDEGVANQYGMAFTPPGLVVLDKSGRLRYRKVGLDDRTIDELRLVVDEMANGLPIQVVDTP